MKILRFTAENIKKLKVVEIVPDGSVVQITGPNGSGKSSVLDAIYYALAGTSHIPAQPVRKGQEKATVKLDLGEVVVTRKFHGESTTLKVEAVNGAQFPSPQKMLDDLLGALAFDPLEFTRMAPKDQLNALKRLVPLTVDVDAIDTQNKIDFDSRTAINRRVKELQAQVDAIKVDPHLPGEAVDVSALTEKLQDAGQANADREGAIARAAARGREAEAKLAQGQQLLEEADDHKRRAEEALQRAQRLRDEADAITTELEGMPAIAPAVDTTDIRAQIDKAAETNKAIDLREGRKALQKKLKEAETQSEYLTQGIAKRTEDKQAAIAAAKMPVEGLGFGADGVTYGELPFDQASSAEQLRVSVAIAMAANPKLRVLRIKDGSLLDENGLTLIAGMAAAEDYQVWIERVDTSGKVGVVMEDGEVKEVKS